EAALATIYAKEQIIKKLEQQLADNKKKDDFLCQHKEIEVKLIIEDTIEIATGKLMKKTTNPKKTKSNKSFKTYLKRIEDPNYQGGSWALPENATTSEKTKYELCEKVIKYKRNKQFTTEKLAQKIQLSKAEMEDILYCRIDYLTLDRLLAYTDKLFAPAQVEIVIKEPKPRKRIKITITDYYQQKPGRKMITHELIVELVKTLNGRQAEPEPKENPNDQDAEELGINILDDIEKTGIETWIKEMLIIYDNKKTNTNKTPQQQSDLDTKKQQLKDLENKQKELEKPLDLTVLITKLQSEIKQLEKKTNRTEAEENSLQIKKKQSAVSWLSVCVVLNYGDQALRGEYLKQRKNQTVNFPSINSFLTNEIPVSESNINNDEEEEKD
ncbi:11107_t:CDS:2, partial [Entrophospora sp. SA101]